MATTRGLRGTPIQNEPKRKNRFILEFPTELNIESYLVQTSSRPSIKINSVEIPYLNSVDYVAGKYTWDTIDIEFIDHIGPSSSQKIMEWVRLHAESLTGRMGYAAGYKKNLSLYALDPVNVEVEKWVLYECMITSASFDSNDMGSDEVQKVKITVQPKMCELMY